MMIGFVRATKTIPNIFPPEKPLNVLEELNKLPNNVLFTLAPIDSKTIEAAKECITNLSRLVKRHHLPWIKPYVTTKGDGDVCFKWWQDNNKLLALTIKPNGNVEMIKIWGAKISRKMKMGWQPSNSELLDTWEWLTSNRVLN